MVERGVWRVRLRSEANGVDHHAAQKFALKESLVGAGWGLIDLPQQDQLLDKSFSVDEYEVKANKIFANDKSLRKAIDVFGRVMSIGDICWTYTPGTGEYWCGEITGEFVYRCGGCFDQHDLHILRPCRWVCVGTAEAVPGVIIRAFAGRFGVVSRIKTGSVIATNEACVALGLQREEISNDLFSVASPIDLEDVVAMYLQESGWRLLPSTSKTTMASYEFVVIHRNSRERAGVQVKSGAVWTLDQMVASGFDKFFVFVAGRSSTMPQSDNRIEQIDHVGFLDFARKNQHLLPIRLQRKWKP